MEKQLEDQSLQYEAAIVRRDKSGKQTAEQPQRFARLEDALNYTKETPLSDDGNRPWIRDCFIKINTTSAFLMVGGRSFPAMEQALAQH